MSEADYETIIRGFHWARGDAGITQEECVHAINQVRAMKLAGLKADWILRGMLLVKDIDPAGDLICRDNPAVPVRPAPEEPPKRRRGKP